MNTPFESYWGIDVSKEWIDIAIESDIFRVEQTEAKIVEFISKYRDANKKTRVVLESTGGHERLAVGCLSLAGLTVHVAHPNKVSAFAKAKGRLAKTDRIDAKILCSYGKFISLHEIRELPTKEQQTLQLLGARLEQLKGMHHQEICRMGMVGHSSLKKSHELMLKVLKQEIQEITQQVEEMIQASEALKEKYTLLQTMKGVGKTLAMVLLIDLPELGKATKREVAALVGVAPLTRESGQKTGKACTKYGRQGVRKVLYMAALTACRYNPILKVVYERLVARGKAKKVAIVAVMRRMLVILNAMIKTKTAFTC